MCSFTSHPRGFFSSETKASQVQVLDGDMSTTHSTTVLDETTNIHEYVRKMATTRSVNISGSRNSRKKTKIRSHHGRSGPSMVCTTGR